MYSSLLACSLFASVTLAAEPLPRKHSNTERLAIDCLEAVHADVEKLKALCTEIDKGMQSLDEGEGRALDMEDFLRDKNSRHGGA